jgi:YjbE family integral membrane protein
MPTKGMARFEKKTGMDNKMICFFENLDEYFVNFIFILLNNLINLYTSISLMLEQLFITTQILIIDVVMAADNAIIIGLIAANFAPDNRKKIIAWGVAAAFIFRIFFATGANYIFEFAWIKILGGILLIWVINNLRQDFFGQNKVRSPQLKSKETKSFSTGVYQVLIADLTLSFDNVLAVVAASKGNFHIMVIGLLLSVFLIATLASFFADFIKKHQWLGYLGLITILIIAIQLIIGGLVNLEVLSINEKFKFLFAI